MKVDLVLCTYRYLPPIREGERSALRLGRLNEPRIRAAMRQHLIEHDILLLDHKEQGLSENRELPEICSSFDDTGIIYDLKDNKQMKLSMFELKTVTTTEKINAAQAIATKYGKFTRIKSSDAGRTFSYSFYVYIGSSISQLFRYC